MNRNFFLRIFCSCYKMFVFPLLALPETIHLELLEIDLPNSKFIFLISGSVICGKFPVEYIHEVFEIMDD